MDQPKRGSRVRYRGREYFVIASSTGGAVRVDGRLVSTGRSVELTPVEGHGDVELREWEWDEIEPVDE